MDVYGFLLAGFLITMGTLGDRIGRRRLLLTGAAAFGAGSALAAFAPNPEALIAARALLGVAAATLAPSTLSLIRNMFHDPGERAVAVGAWVASFSAGGAVGPLVGGVLLAHFWWGSVFLAAVPVMLLLLALGPYLLAEFRDPDAGRLDLPSVALSLVAVLAVIYGVKRLAERGGAWPSALAIAAGLAVGALFLRRQRTLADPLIDLGLLRTPAIAAALAVNVLCLFAAFGVFLMFSQYLQLVLGMGPLEAGLWTAPSGVVFVVGSLMTPLLARRFRPAHIMAAGLALAALGLAALTRVAADGTPWVLFAGYLVFCLGIAPVGTLTTDMVVGTVPPERAGAVSSISETSFELGAALGVAVLGSIVTAAHRGLMDAAVAGGVRAEWLSQGARDTLGRAVALAGRLPGGEGDRLLAVARAAFEGSLEVAAVVCAVLTAATAVLTMLTLRGVPSATAPAA